jgi:transposase
MLCWIIYYFRLEDQIPETHLLRLIEKHISFAFVREKLKDSYSETGTAWASPLCRNFPRRQNSW